jgi:hypothetical protein
MRPMIERGGLAILALVLVAAVVGAFSAAGQEPPKNDLKQIMERKLKHAQTLLEGLAEEDFPLIRDNARELRKVGEDSLKRISPNLTYVKYVAEFVSIVDELDRRAKDENLNGTTLSYIRLTMNCVECHKFVRDDRILDQRKKAK